MALVGSTRSLSLLPTRVVGCSFCTSSVRLGKKSRIPFDKRFPVTAKDVHRHKEGGSVEMEKAVALHSEYCLAVIDVHLLSAGNGPGNNNNNDEIILPIPPIGLEP